MSEFERSNRMYCSRCLFIAQFVTTLFFVISPLHAEKLVFHKMHTCNQDNPQANFHFAGLLFSTHTKCPIQIGIFDYLRFDHYENAKLKLAFREFYKICVVMSCHIVFHEI